MGCGNSTLPKEPLAQAEAINPPAGAAPAASASAAAASHNNGGGGGGEAKTANEGTRPKGAAPAAAAVPAPAPVPAEASAAPAIDALPADVPATVSPSLLSSVLSASLAARGAFGSEASLPSALVSSLDAGSLDGIGGEWVSDQDIAAVVEIITGGGEEAVAPSSNVAADGQAVAPKSLQLFSEATTSLEVTPQSLAELILLAGSSSEVVRLLRALDARGKRCDSMHDLPSALAQQQRDEVEASCALLPPEEKIALLQAHDFLAQSTCDLYPYARIPRVSTTGADAADPSQSLSHDHDEELELDFNQLNQQLTHTRVRANFLRPAFLAQLVHAGGRGPKPHQRHVVLLMLQHLALGERSFELPSELLTGVLEHRAQAVEAQRTLRAASVAAGSAGAAADGEGAGAEATMAPPALVSQLLPLQHSLLGLEPACISLSALMSPLQPTLESLLPTMRHLQAYLSRFLPLLGESSKAARDSGVNPGDDAATAQILRAYLIPFLKLTQPWIIQLRPYLAGLQPLFTELQPFLGATHKAYTDLQSFVHALDPLVRPAPQAWIVMDAAFAARLASCMRSLTSLHPLLKQLHPFCEGLREFTAELGVFLGQLQSLLDTLQTYQTLPLEEEADPVAPEDSAVSSIAIPWFRDGAASSRPGSAQEKDAGLSAPQFLAQYGRFLSKLAPYTSQLRPFASEMQGFVAGYTPFLGQLAPFYSQALKAGVQPLLLYLAPTDNSAAEVEGEATKGWPELPSQQSAVAAATVTATSSSGSSASNAADAATKQQAEAEMDEAALQRLLSS